MATFLFWNLNRKGLKDHIVALCREHGVDVLILAEADIREVDLLEALNKDEISKFRLAFNPSPRLKFFVRFPSVCFKPVIDEGGVSVRRLVPPVGTDVLIVAVHLPSKLYYKEIDQVFQSTRLAEIIREAERAVGHSRTVVVGDFNMNPFESGFISADGLHAVMDKRIAQRIARTVQGKRREFFYNPMWGRMGDNSPGPPGTYFYSDSSHVCYFWNTFDQVLLRPAILQYFRDDSLEIPITAAGEPLLSEAGRPGERFTSDHLPILFTINIEREV